MFKSSVFKAIVFGLLAVSSAAVAGTSATVNLGGTVTSSLEITSVSTGGASALDLSGGQKIVKVADIEMSTNNEQGLTLTASSGNITKTGGSPIAFKVTSVGNAGDPPVAGDFTVASGSNYTVGTSGSGSVDKDLYILYTPLTLQDPGDYTGSISLTVADN